MVKTGSQPEKHAQTLFKFRKVYIFFNLYLIVLKGTQRDINHKKNQYESFTRSNTTDSPQIFAQTLITIYTMGDQHVNRKSFEGCRETRLE